MEKLQAAIQRARQMRNGVTPPEAQPLPPAAATPGMIRPHDVSHAMRQSPQTQPGAAGKSVVGWEHLPMETVNVRQLRRNRLVAFSSGRDSAPHDMLRTRILHMARVKNWHRIALVSPHQGSGKTTTAANLAFSCGRQHDRRTMILDLDLRRIGLSKMFGIRPAYGMGDVLSGHVPFQEHAVRVRDNVVLGLNNAPADSASEILQSHSAQTVLDDIEKRFKPDIMLFDMPPLLVTDDSVGFLRNVDCAVLIAEVGQTTIKQIDMAEQQISEMTNVMGVVLNKASAFEVTYGYE